MFGFLKKIFSKDSSTKSEAPYKVETTPVISDDHLNLKVVKPEVPAKPSTEAKLSNKGPKKAVKTKVKVNAKPKKDTKKNPKMGQTKKPV